MNNSIQIFKNKSFGEIKVVIIDGEPYFPATECAKLLGYSNAKDAIIRHCRSVVKRDLPHPQNPAKKLKVNLIPESDLYRLIAHSKLPDAQKFEKWIYENVLISIRKYGSYIEPETLDKIRKSPKFAEELLKKLRGEQEKNKLLGRRIDELEPKAVFCDEVLNCDNLIPISIIAKDYGMTAIKFNKLLNDFRIQYKLGDTWLLYEEFADKGYTKTRAYPVSENKASIHTYWTFEGYKFLYEFLKFYGITPLYECDFDDDLPF